MKRWTKAVASLAAAAALALSLAPAALASDEASGQTEHTIGVGQPVEVAYDGVAEAYAFAPATDGWYRFCSTGIYDTYLDVYADVACEQRVGHNDDGGEERNFQLTLYVNAGQTLYLVPRLYDSDDSGTFTMDVAVDAKLTERYADIENWTICSPEPYVDCDGAHVPDFVLETDERSDGGYCQLPVLTEGVDFTASWAAYDEESSEYVALSGKPSEVGNYEVTFTPLEDSGLSGSSTRFVTVRDYRTLEEWGYDDPNAYFDQNGYHAPVFVLYYENESGERVTLEQGTHFTATSVAYNDETGEYEDTTVEPSGSGYYSARLTAVAGAKVTGSKIVSYYVNDFRDLSEWSADIDNDSACIDESGFHEPTIELYRWGADDERVKLVQGKDYVIGGYAKYNEDTERYEDVSGNPTEGGNYQVELVPAQGSALTGSITITLYVNDYLDLSSFYAYASREAALEDGVFSAPAFSVYRYKDDEQVDLTLGTDYVVSAYERYDEATQAYVAVIGDPTAGGDAYRAKLTPAEGSVYKGTRYVTFTVRDYCELKYWDAGYDRAYIDGEGYHAPRITLYRYNSKGEEVTLEQDKDFCISAYSYYDSEKDETIEISEPTSKGSIDVVLTAKEGSTVRGEKTFSIYVYDYNDLAGWEIGWDADAYIENGVYHAPAPLTLTSWFGDVRRELVLGCDFLIDGYAMYDEDAYTYKNISGEPTKRGKYRMTLVPVQGTVYTGKKAVQISVRDYACLEDWHNFSISSVYLDGDGFHEPTIKPYRRDADGKRIELVQGKDFRIAGYAKYNEDTDRYEDVSGDPTEGGEYLVELEAVEGSGLQGSTSTWMEIDDYRNLANWDVDQTVSGCFDETGAYHEPGFYLYRYGDKGKIKLKQGRDFVIDAYQRYDDATDAYVDVVGTPNEGGEDFRIVLKPVSGSGLTGTRAVSSVAIADYRDISAWGSHVDTEASLEAGVFTAPRLALSRPVESGARLWMDEDAYEISGYRAYDMETGTYKDLDGVPSAFGEYAAVVVGTAGSGLTGQKVVPFEMADPMSLASCSYERFSVVLGDEGFKLPAIEVYRYDANGDRVDLEQGKHYTVASVYERYDGDEDGYVAITGDPSAAGEYRVKLTAVDGGGYNGSRYVYFDVYKQQAATEKALSDCSYSVTNTEVVNGIVPVPAITLYEYDEDEDATQRVSLEEGKHYTVTSYQYYDEERGSYVAVPETPEKAGRYRVTLTAVEGGGYVGTKRVTFDIVDYRDIQYWQASCSSVELVAGGSLVPQVELYRWRDDDTRVALELDRDFEIAGYLAGDGDDDEDGQTLLDAPTGAGEYRVVLRAKEGSGYTGQHYVWFDIIDYADIANWSIFVSEATIDASGYHAPEVEVYRYSDDSDDRVTLVAGTDYELVGYKSYDRVFDEYESMDGVPQQAGQYELTIRGIGSYSGTTDASMCVIKRTNSTAKPADGAIVKVKLAVLNEVQVIPFTADKDGVYTFYSDDAFDTYLSLYEDAACSTLIGRDDDSGVHNNFSYKLNMAKGQTVYLVARMYDRDDLGTIRLGMEYKIPEVHDHAYPDVAYTWGEGHNSCTAQAACDVCGERVSATATVTSEVTTPPTCEKSGVRTYTATFAESWAQTQTATSAVEPTGHDWGAWQVVKPATADEEGLEERVCANDPAHKETRAIPKHVHAYVDTVVAPTCTEDGYTEHACSLCGDSYRDNIVEALGHDWKVTEEAVPATCETDGKTAVETCSRCNETRGGEKVAALGHDWGAWEVVTPATTEAAGVERRVCSRCGKEETRPIAKLPATDTKPATDSGATTGGTTTGGTTTGSASSSVPTKVTGEVSPANPVAASAVESLVTSAKSDADPKGSSFTLLQAKGVAKSNKAIKLTWAKVAGAKQYVVYGNKCGKANKCVKVKSTSARSLTVKGLKKGTYYKYIVVAVAGDKALATSKTIHVATKGGKVGNPGKVTTKVKKNKLSLAKGKSAKLKAKQVAASKKLKVKKHRALAYESANPKVASVSKAGKVKAVGKGTCYVYAYAQNGVFAKVKVTVK